MATTTTNPGLSEETPVTGVGTAAWPRGGSATAAAAAPARETAEFRAMQSAQNPTHGHALQALLAFAALHEQMRRRKALAARHGGVDAGVAAAESRTAEFEPQEQFVLDEVLQLVAQRGAAITGADGLAIALAENNEIVLRAAAGNIRPDVGARIDRESAFSGACFRQAQVVTCDDTETDPRVNLQACRKLGARSMVAVPLCGRRRVIGVLEAFCAWPFGFNDSDVRNLTLLAELVLGALKPEDEDRFAQSAQVAGAKLEASALVSGPVQSAVAPVVTAAAETQAPAVVIAQPKVVQAAAAPAILDQPATDAEKAPVVETPTVAELVAEAPAEVAAETVAEPELTFGQLEPEKKARPAMLVLLLVIIVGAAFAAGVWWKLKTAQLGSVMVRTEKIEPRAPSAGKTPAASEEASAAPAASANPTTEAGDETGEQSAPATPQELSKFPRITGIRHWSAADSSTVVLDLEDQVQYEAHRLAGPDRIYFDLRDTQLAPALAGKSIEIGDTLLSRVRVAQPVAGMTRIVLETKANSNFSVSLEPNPYRLVVEVRKLGATPKGAVNLFPNAEAEKNKLAIVIPPPTREDLALRARVPKMKIVVDAGHGGWDLGTVGKRGLLEKDLVFEISQRLGKLLESRLGSEVIYTRPDDNYITLDDRATIANQSQADLFVSVHANYSDLPSARGVETYYTNFFTAPGAKDVDTHAAAGAAKSAATPTLSPADLHERIELSRRLAASVQRSLYGTLSAQNPGLRDRGIKEAGFVVLTESAMPGILAEVSFVSSPTDEQKLRSDGYREQIAEALYRGIARYAATSKGVKVASAAK